MLVLASFAHAATVCPKGTTGCDHDDLADALGSQEPVLELQPGLHVGGVTVDHRVELVALPGARVRGATGREAVFTVVAGGSGSSFDGLNYETDPVDDGPLMAVVGADVTVVDAKVRFAYSNGAPPGFRVEQGGALTLQELEIEDSNNLGDGMITVDDSVLVVVGGRFARNSATRGGAIWATGRSTVTVTDTLFQQVDSLSGLGNAIWMQGGSLTLENVTVEAWEFATDGAEIELDALDALVIVGGSFASPTGPTVTSAVRGAAFGTVDLAGSVFAGWNAGAVRIDGASGVTVEDVVFDRNESAKTGGAMWITADDVRVDRSWFCHNEGQYGGALDLTCDTCVVTGSVFYENSASASGGAITADSGLAVDHSTFRGNTSNGAAAIYTAEPTPMETTIVVEHEGSGGALDWLVPAVFRTNALYDNVAADATFPISDQNQRDVPVVFEDGPGRCGPSATPTRDGNDWVWDHGVGAIADQDRDGFLSDQDCDDTRPDVFPGAPEIVADGVDQDCDGVESCPADTDGDGFAGDEDRPGAFDCAPDRGDCADDDAAIRPGAADPPYDGVDADCAGNDDFDLDQDGIPVSRDCDDERPGVGACAIRLGGGCSTGPVSGVVGLLLSLVWIRRR